MKNRILTSLLVATSLGTLSCGSNGTGFADRCRSACDPSAVMSCVKMDPAACQRDCESLTTGLSKVCVICLTETTAWKVNPNQTVSGVPVCSGYGFPSVAATTNGGCGTACAGSQ